MHTGEDEQAPAGAAQPALVLARWHSWVRLYFPATGETAWVDLREVGFEILETGARSTQG
jgi:hypothetical protein